MNYNAGDIQTMAEELGLPVIPNTVRTFNTGTWTADFEPGLTPEQQTLRDSVIDRLDEKQRIAAINTEANKRVAAITGDQAQINQDLALAVGLMYAELRGQLSAPTQARLDPVASKSQQAASIRAQAAAMIANPQLTWE